MLKTVLVVVFAVMLAGTGHVFLSKAMRAVGDLTEAPADRLGGMVRRALSSPWFLVGVALQASFFVIYLTLLSRADVSLVLPLTAMDYIVVGVLAQYLLGETLTLVRWAGIGFIVVGVGLVSRT